MVDRRNERVVNRCASPLRLGVVIACVRLVRQFVLEVRHPLLEVLDGGLQFGHALGERPEVLAIPGCLFGRQYLSRRVRLARRVEREGDLPLVWECRDV